jgi:DNA-binding response OmpR family regulator
MKQPRILVVDDEQDLCEILCFNLEMAGYEVVVAYSAEEALGMMEHIDMLLLDVMMPGMSGFELAGQLKRSERTASIPIIFLTAKDTEEDMLRGFEMGADDYVAKPFSIREVLARVKAVLGRSATNGDIIRFRNLCMDVQARRVVVDGQEVALTKTEFSILHLLLTHQGRVFTRNQLIERVWPTDVVVTERTVDVNLTRLRKKIGEYAACISNKTGFGYYFQAYEET